MAPQIENGCILLNSVAESIPNTTPTAVSFDTINSDASTMFDALNPTRINIRKTGFYLLFASVQYAAAAGGTTRQAILKKNGVTTIVTRELPPSGNGENVDVIWPCGLNAGDFIELFCNQDSGGAVNVNGDGVSLPTLGAIRLG